MRGITAFIRSGVIIGVVLVITMGLLWLLYYSYPLALFFVAPIAMLLSDSVRSWLKARAATSELAALRSEQAER